MLVSKKPPRARVPSPPDQGQEQAPRRPSKKEQILSLFAAGIQEVPDIAAMTHSRPSYIASVLHEAGFLEGYHDLYTSS